MNPGIAVYGIGLLFIGCLVVVGQGKHLFYMFLQRVPASSFQKLFHLCVYNGILQACNNIAYGIGRPDAGSNYQGGHAHASMVALSIDESKLHFKMCLPRDCKTKGEAWNYDCTCCVTMPGIPCYYSDEECEKNCPPVTAMELHARRNQNNDVLY
jgi:hypothetical protein